MDKSLNVRSVLGIVAKGAVATALIASMAVGTLGSVGSRTKGYSLDVADGTYAQQTTATVEGSTNSLSSSTQTDMWVYATCYQAGHLVYWEDPQVDSTMTATLTLGPTAWWTGGSADCNADLRTFDSRHGRWVTLNSTSFHVAG